MESALWQKHKSAEPLVTVPDLYQSIDEFIEFLLSVQPSSQELESQSALAKHELRELVSGIRMPLSALTSGDLALRSLRLGMVNGIVDGLRLQDEDVWSEQSRVPPDSPLSKSWGILWKNLEDARIMARDNWSKMERDDIHLLWEYGRHQNLDTLQQAIHYADHEEPLRFQIFLLATFKAGYAVAVAQSVWKFG